jgi:hypothetical protein
VKYTKKAQNALAHTYVKLHKNENLLAKAFIADTLQKQEALEKETKLKAGVVLTENKAENETEKPANGWATARF